MAPVDGMPCGASRKTEPLALSLGHSLWRQALLVTTILEPLRRCRVPHPVFHRNSKDSNLSKPALRACGSSNSLTFWSIARTSSFSAITTNTAFEKLNLRQVRCSGLPEGLSSSTPASPQKHSRANTWETADQPSLRSFVARPGWLKILMAISILPIPVTIGSGKLIPRARLRQ